MKMMALLLLAATCSAPIFADALPLDWFRKRNGLTDAQVDDIFEKNPNAVLRLSRGKWMELKYRLHRFDNMRGWLNMQIEGKLGDEILRVSDTNAVLVASNSTLRVSCAHWKNVAEYYEVDGEMAKRIKKANKNADKTMQKMKKDLEQGRKKATTDEERECYDAWLALIESEVNGGK